MTRKKALVIGATGVIGSYLANHLIQTDDWEVTGVSRHAPESQSGIRYLALDLLNTAECRDRLQELTDITHIFYAAYQDFPYHSPQQVTVNLQMLRNAIIPVEKAAPGLKRILLMQGMKVYGSHLGPFKTPAKETDPRHLPPNFYYEQEDFLRERQQGKMWAWTVLRPDAVCGFSVGNPMNIAMVIAVYASVSKQLGLPLRFPGKPGAYSALAQVTDASLLARAAEWAAVEEKGALEVFNVTNGDFFRWKELWRKIAEFFEMELAEPQTVSLAAMMADKEELWQHIAGRHGLRDVPYAKLAAWPFADYVFGKEYDVMADTTKLRNFGFHEVQDSEAMFLRLFEQLRREKIIP
jgi:nucleoside-diphosphate-sugar epimerase